MEANITNPIARTVNRSGGAGGSLCHVDYICVKSRIRDATACPSGPEVNAAVAILPTIIHTHVMANNITVKCPGTAELRQQIPGSIIVMRIVILNNRISHTAVQIKPTAIFAATGAIVMGFVELKNYTICIPCPDPNRSTAIIIVQSPVLVSTAAFNQSTLNLCEDNAVSRMTPFSGDAGISIRTTPTNIKVSM